MGLFNLFKPARTVLVVDVAALNESLGMKGNVAPRNQLQALRRLARFAQREKIEVVAVATGSALNKAPGGEEFDGITVLYSKSSEDHPAFLVRTARSKGAGAILVSGNAAAEKMFGGSGRTMRITTFRKVFDTDRDFETEDRGPGGRPNRPPRKSRPKQAPAESAQERPPREREMPDNNNNNDAINELIDLVD